MADIVVDLARFGKSNVVSLKDLHSFCGKPNHAAGLLVVLRPFLHPLWAALYAPPCSTAPAGTVWTKQVSATFTWLRAFFNGTVGGITRRFDLDAYLRRGSVVEIGTDASPIGLGGWLSIDGVVVNHFSSPVQTEDVDTAWREDLTSVSRYGSVSPYWLAFAYGCRDSVTNESACESGATT